MNSGRRMRTVRTLITLILGFVLWVDVGLAQDELQLGGISYARTAAQPLMRTQARPGRFSARFFRGVGGVAFQAVAVGVNDAVVTGLFYDSTAPDGQRLRVTVREGGQSVKVVGDLYDWEIVPLASYANSEKVAAITLFGSLYDTDAHEAVIAQGGRVINYHPALDNTLLGLRLFQSDILIIQENAADLFKDASGNYLMGAGEGTHELLRNQSRLLDLQTWLGRRLGAEGPFQSYVVTDLGQEITFAPINGRLEFSGHPRWELWQNPPHLQKDIDILRAIGLLWQFDESGRSDEDLSSGERMELESAVLLYESFESSGASLDSLFTHVSELDMDTVQVKEMPELSTALSEKIRELDGVNPTVYRTVTRSMHYAALFRHFAQRDAAAYRRFLNSLRGVPVRPSVVTPTVQRGTGPGSE